MVPTTIDAQPSNTNHSKDDFDDLWLDSEEPQVWIIDPGFKEFCFQKLAEMETLESGWDYEGAPTINRSIINTIREFIILLPPHISTRPMVVPLSSGNVQLEWHRGQRVLELEFESPKEVHYLKWDPVHQIEEEAVIPASKRDELVSLIQWFMKEELSD